MGFGGLGSVVLDKMLSVLEQTRQAQQQRGSERLCLFPDSALCLPKSTAKEAGKIVLGHGLNHELRLTYKTSSKSALGEYG